MNYDIRSIVLFLNMKGKEKNQIKIEINNTFHQKIIGYSTVTKYFREDYFASHKTIDENDQIKFEHLHFQELILNALKDYPFYSSREISEITNIPKTTVYRILTNELHFVSSHLKWVSHFLNEAQKITRVKLYKSLLSTIEKVKHQSFYLFFTGDESWIYLSTDHTIQWLHEGDEPSTREKKMIGSKKIMLTVFWNPEGFLVVDLLPEGIHFNSEYFIY